MNRTEPTATTDARPFSRLEPRPPCFAGRLAEMVVQALIDEVTLGPKPGLVDIESRGAHQDLDWTLMCRSANALRGTFEAMAGAGAALNDASALRARIGHLGRLGEAAMMRATAGVNTHRGAIWALGLLVTAAAQAPDALAPQAVCERAAALARIGDPFAPTHTGHKGERACRDFRVGGARGQAQAGFPLLTRLALPELRRSRSRGDHENTCRLNALLTLMSELDDTCVLARGGEHALTQLRCGARAVLATGGANTIAGRRALRRLDAELLTLNVSPGGAGDLLAATLFIDRLETLLTQ